MVDAPLKIWLEAAGPVDEHPLPRLFVPSSSTTSKDATLGRSTTRRETRRCCRRCKAQIQGPLLLRNPSARVATLLRAQRWAEGPTAPASDRIAFVTTAPTATRTATRQHSAALAMLVERATSSVCRSSAAKAAAAPRAGRACLIARRRQPAISSRYTGGAGAMTRRPGTAGLATRSACAERDGRSAPAVAVDSASSKGP